MIGMRSAGVANRCVACILWGVVCIAICKSIVIVTCENSNADLEDSSRGTWVLESCEQQLIRNEVDHLLVTINMSNGQNVSKASTRNESIGRNELI